MRPRQHRALDVKVQNPELGETNLPHREALKKSLGRPRVYASSVLGTVAHPGSVEDHTAQLVRRNSYESLSSPSSVRGIWISGKRTAVSHLSHCRMCASALGAIFRTHRVDSYLHFREVVKCCGSWIITSRWVLRLQCRRACVTCSASCLSGAAPVVSFE